MKKFMDFIELKLAPPLEKLGNQRHLSAIKDGMISVIPLTIIGSFFVLIPNFPIDAWMKFIEPYAPLFNAVSAITIDIVGIVAAGTVAYYFAKTYKDINLNSLTCSVISMTAFLLATLNDEWVINASLFGTKGLFTAVVIALLSTTILHFFYQRNLVIHFPDSVPPLVSESFMSLVPALAVLLIVWLLRVILGFDINATLIKIFEPAVFALNTLPGFLIFMLIRSLLWCVGIHGGAVLAIADPIFLVMLGDNIAAAAAGAPLPYITASGFMYFVFLGGGGATLPLVFLMMRSKEKGFRSLGKLCLAPGIFEINEPVVFGVPLVMNPLMIIPYVLATEVLSIITYGLMYFNLIARPLVNIPWTMPPVLAQYFLTGGDWRAAIWGVISLFVAGAIYYPFFKIMEKQRLNIENEKGMIEDE
ncbi:PTS sugar transporter subunit IIC [Candidatus Stoquefichus massiliensis]|uniref:PTS sugar transporter subunit IIC n=1 Tax=Candidatus Stoquefichus massiliensis TaxID=1470350 RepID=UPI0004802604|nr:PTS transporter subunit EIIC [Candidatus Stoquefichus massiliensis]